MHRKSRCCFLFSFDSISVIPVDVPLFWNCNLLLNFRTRICLENGKSSFTLCSMIWKALATVPCIYIWCMVVFVQSRYFFSILVLVLILKEISNERHVVTGGKVGYFKWQKSFQWPWVKTLTYNTTFCLNIESLAQEMTDKRRAFFRLIKLFEMNISYIHHRWS